MFDLKPRKNVFESLGAREDVPDHSARQKKITQTFFALFAGIFFGFIIWGNVGSLDIASMATGEVVPSSQVKSIQHLEGGIVREILAREGQAVKKGQPIILLEKTISGADVAELQIRITTLEVDIARLVAESSGLDEPKFSEDAISNSTEIVVQAMDRFHVRRRNIDNKVQAQKETVSQRQYDINETESHLENLLEALKFQEEKVSISEALIKDDLSNRYMHLDLLSRANELRGNISESKSTLASAGAALKEAQLNLSQIHTGYMSEVHKELNEARSNYRELNERLIKYQDSLSRTVVRSTVDGIIKTLHVVTEGGVIKPGEPVVDIVPEGDRLVIEAQLPTHDIGYVQVGQEAAIKLASADAARFQALIGTVVAISPDTLLTPDGLPYYKVRIETEKAYFERGSVQYQLYPGMQVIANIKIGTRSVFEYIFSPVFSSLDDALQER